MSDDLVQILDGDTFVVSDRRGDIEASLTDPTGLFSSNTRFLSRWVLTVDGQRLNPLSVDDLQYFETRFFLVPGTGTVYVDAKLSVIRRREVGGGFREELRILNHDEEPVDVKVRVEAASDFADLFEVKDALEKKGTYSSRVDDGKLLLAYERQTFTRATVISASTVTPGVIWVGTNNGIIQTTDDGTAWHDVTPPELTAAATVSIVEAGHHDAATAYAVLALMASR